MKENALKPRQKLPLIDFSLTPSHKIIRGAEFHERIMWLIHLRWLATLGLAIGLPVGQYLMDVHLLTLPLIVLTCILAFHNFISHVITRHLIGNNDYGLHIAANIQISVDLVLLTLLLHFSGGFENPFVISYVYHMIIAAILLTAWTAYFQAAWASTLIGIQTCLTQWGIVNQPHLDGFLELTFFHQTKYIGTFYGVIVFTLFFVVYLTYSISKELKVREMRLEETNEMLREKDRLKSEYVLALSHDLKQSLAAAQTNLKVVLDGYAGEVSDKARSMITTSERRLIQLLGVIRDLLNLSKITSKRNIEKRQVN